jgi:hypothetical protein
MFCEAVQVHDGYSLVGVQSVWPLYAAGRPQVDGAADLEFARAQKYFGDGAQAGIATPAQASIRTVRDGRGS